MAGSRSPTLFSWRAAGGVSSCLCAYSSVEQNIGGSVGSQNNTSQTSDHSLSKAQKQWQVTLGELQLQMTRATFDTWLRGSQVVAYEDNTFTIFVRHAYAVDWLQNRLLPIIRRTLQRHTSHDVDIVFTARDPKQTEDLMLVPETVEEEEAQHPRSLRLTSDNGQASTVLKPCYTFDSFVVGTSNRLAHAASLAVAENPAHAYNPLFIYGGVGLGKTHLLHALGHEAQKRSLRVLYVSSEWFTNDLIQAIRSQKTKKFRAKYRNNDVLLVDDIQFIAGKERTQEEFFHTFNALHGAGKQIVVTCDRPPKALVALEDRLRSRFGWGLIADVQPPDFETRAAILRTKAEARSVQVLDDVLTYIARRVPSNIRELEGALTRVLAYANLIQLPLTVETARVALDSILAHPVDLSPQKIITTVAQHYDLPEEELIGRSRRRTVSHPRQLCMYIIREETDTSLPQIGELLGGRDHTTVLHGIDKITELIETNDQVRRDWLAIKERLSD
jgi:chromosomal replication initiator protein